MDKILTSDEEVYREAIELLKQARALFDEYVVYGALSSQIAIDDAEERISNIFYDNYEGVI